MIVYEEKDIATLKQVMNSMQVTGPEQAKLLVFAAGLVDKGVQKEVKE